MVEGLSLVQRFADGAQCTTGLYVYCYGESEGRMRFEVGRLLRGSLSIIWRSAAGPTFPAAGDFPARTKGSVPLVALRASNNRAHHICFTTTITLPPTQSRRSHEPLW